MKPKIRIGYRVAVSILAALTITSFIKNVDACDMGTIPGLPKRQDIHAAGIVLRHTEIQRPIDVSSGPTASRSSRSIDHAASMIVKITDVISGDVATGETEVVPLFFGPDCSSTSRAYEELKRAYPEGSHIAVFAPVTRSSNSTTRQRIVVEANRGGFVSRIPDNLKRTPHGDLAFDRYQSWVLGQFEWFEFDRAVLALPHAKKSDLFDRLLNLSHFDQFPAMPNGRVLFDRLIAETGVPASQREVLLKAFDETRPYVR
jgi:hypothetical protein